jgi:hypothetical protein
MIIIFEGPNGVGKTTIAKNVSDIYNLNYIKESKPVGGYKYYIKRSLEEKDCVFDRFHLGEFVYPSLMNDEREIMNDWQQHLIERILQIKNALLIYCDSTYENKKNIFLTRGEEYVSIDKIEDESLLFKECVERSILNRIHIDPLSNNYENLYNFIEKYNNNLDKNFIKYESIGCFYNPIMLIGERYGSGEDFNFGKNIYLKTFIDTKLSSRYLHQALKNFKQKFYITNLYKVENNEINLKLITEEINLIKPTKIILLGNKVEKLFKELNLLYYKMPHPQYYNRFKNKNIDEYESLFKDIIDEK